MGSSAWIRGWLDRPEEIPSLGIRHEPTVSLEVGVHFFPAASSRVEVYPFPVHLPKFNCRMAERVAFDIRDLAPQIGDRPHGWRKRIVYDYKVVVRIERQLVWKERARRLGRCQGKLLSHESWGCEQWSKGKAFAEEVAASEDVHSLIIEEISLPRKRKNGINGKLFSKFGFVLHCERQFRLG